jgi:hypothetical protein
MATAIARTHMRARVQSPMLMTSAIAPIVQKWVRWASAPNKAESANEAHSTRVARVVGSMSDMSRIVAARGAETCPRPPVGRPNIGGCEYNRNHQHHRGAGA